MLVSGKFTLCFCPSEKVAQWNTPSQSRFTDWILSNSAIIGWHFDIFIPDEVANVYDLPLSRHCPAHRTTDLFSTSITISAVIQWAPVKLTLQLMQLSNSAPLKEL